MWKPQGLPLRREKSINRVERESIERKLKMAPSSWTSVKEEEKDPIWKKKGRFDEQTVPR